LTQSVLPAVKKVNGRVIIVTSGLNSRGVDFRDDPTLISNQYDSDNGMLRYGTTKLMNVLYAKKLSREGVLSFSVHPGILKTDLHRADPGMDIKNWRGYLMNTVVYPLIGISKDEGAAATLYLATCQVGNSGSYYHGIIDSVANPLADDIQLQEFLYDYSLQLMPKQ